MASRCKRCCQRAGLHVGYGEMLHCGLIAFVRLNGVASMREIPAALLLFVTPPKPLVVTDSRVQALLHSF
jgi:hypothetical protein